MHTFIRERPLEDSSGRGDGLGGAGSARKGEVTVDDAALAIGRFENGALANLEATRFALGRKNCIEIEINGSLGSLCFDFEDMNRLKHFDNSRPEDRQGFADILVTQPGRRPSLRGAVVAAGAHRRLRAHLRPHPGRLRQRGGRGDSGPAHLRGRDAQPEGAGGGGGVGPQPPVGGGVGALLD